ncbi:MAG: hypothetical protein AAFU41_12845 [Pseudomonadota bacterium]
MIAQTVRENRTKVSTWTYRFLLLIVALAAIERLLDLYWQMGALHPKDDRAPDTPSLLVAGLRSGALCTTLALLALVLRSRFIKWLFTLQMLLILAVLLPASFELDDTRIGVIGLSIVVTTFAVGLWIIGFLSRHGELEPL